MRCLTQRAGHLQKQRRDEAVRRDWGDTPQRREEEATEFAFYPVLDESSLHGRHVVVNRAPVLTAWCVVVLEYMGFATPEALSLAQCYVSTTALARAKSLGRVADTPSATVSANQPHMEFMGVKIPVIALRSGLYRGLHNGQIVQPAQAFEYLRKSMFQTLPQVMGAMMLLASSYVDSTWRTDAESAASHSADGLHKAAYRLYTEFRPETGGEWGKRASLHLDTVLALRRTASAFHWPPSADQADAERTAHGPPSQPTSDNAANENKASLRASASPGPVAKPPSPVLSRVKSEPLDEVETGLPTTTLQPPLPP